MRETRLLGHVEVDSGTLLVGDPTYLLRDDRNGKPGADYAEVIAAPWVPAIRLGDRPVLLIQDFGGDGSFPVLGEFEDGHLVRLCVDFVEPDDE